MTGHSSWTPFALLTALALLMLVAPTTASADTFASGDRVECNWKSGGKFYKGKVAEVRAGGKIFIHYDDGDKEETTPALCRAEGAAAAVAVGTRVECNWKNGGKFYKGQIGEVRAAGKIFVLYDDGDKEETTPAMCRAEGGGTLTVGGGAAPAGGDAAPAGGDAAPAGGGEAPAGGKWGAKCQEYFKAVPAFCDDAGVPDAYKAACPQWVNGLKQMETMISNPGITQQMIDQYETSCSATVNALNQIKTTIPK